MKIAILDDYQGVALKSADWSSLPKDCQITIFKEHLTGAALNKEALGDFEIIVAMRERTPFPKELLAGLPNLKVLITTGMRNASIDMEAASRQKVLVCGTRGGGPSTAELAWGLILSLLRHIPQEFAGMKEGKWQTTVGADLKGKTLGLLGLGNLGSHMAIIGNAFGMRVVAWSQNLTAEKASQHKAMLMPKDEFFRHSDIISIHLQLSDRTRGLVGRRELGMMKPAAFLINTSRGPIVDEAALIDVLRSHAIAGAGIDVYDTEPLPPAHPLRTLDNVVITPHLGYVTQETYQVFYGDALEDILAYLKGKPVRALNLDMPKAI